jgi:hypothetical protein
VIEMVNGDQRAPAWVGAPGRGWRIAAGQGDEAVGRQGGQKRVAQPSVDRAELLVAVDEQDGTRQDLGDPAAAGPVAEADQDGMLKPLRGGIDLPAIEQHHGSARGPRAAAELQQDGGLADASRTVDEQHSPRRPVHEGVVEAGQLAPAAHEGPASRLVEKITELGRHRTTLQHAAR